MPCTFFFYHPLTGGFCVLLGPQNRCPRPLMRGVHLCEESFYGRSPFLGGCPYRVSLKKWPGPQTGVRLQEVSASGASTVLI